jgi:hypothetical protein
MNAHQFEPVLRDGGFTTFPSYVVPYVVDITSLELKRVFSL